MRLIKKNGLPIKFTWRSITFKWTIITSIVISALFTVYAIVTYHIVSDIRFQLRKDEFVETMDDVNKWLSMADKPLTAESTIFYLEKSTDDVEVNQYYNEMMSKIGLNDLNHFVSELSQPEFNIKIYGTDESLLFETKKDPLPFNVKKQKNITIKKINNVGGLLLLKPLYSEQNGILIGYMQGFYELSDYYKVRNNIIKALIFIQIVGIVVSLIIGYILSSYFTSPLRKMAKVLNGIEDAHKTGIHMPIFKSNDEFSDLAQAFNDMVERMQKFILRQNQFVEDVSHELRTPVAVIEGHLSLLTRWGKDDPEVLEESLEASLQEIIRMKSLVQEMLDLSRVEQAEFQHIDDTTMVKEIVHVSVNNFRILYPEFKFYLDDDLKQDVEIHMYRNHLEQILIILMDNAVKYSTTRKEVMVSLSLITDSIEIMVQDFGEGISKEDLDKIFDRFYRVDSARARNTGGNGLGLSIAYQLIENYNGTIKVKSHPNQGSAFIFTIPMVLNDTSEH